MKVQDRDLELLTKLFRLGVLSTNQIATHIFNGVAITTVLRRLRLIESASLIIQCGHLSSGEKVWSLSKPGASLIKASEPFRHSNQNTLNHDVCLSEVRMALEGIGIGQDWTSEQEMKRNLAYKHDSVVPDGLFVGEVSGEGKVVAVELELTAKSHKRYKKVFRDYCSMNAIEIIWYIVKDVSITKPLLKQWQEAKRFKNTKTTQKLLISYLDDLIQNKFDSEIFDEKMQRSGLSVLFTQAKSGQGLSKYVTSDLSTQTENDLQANQQLISAPEAASVVPSVPDSSPTTLLRSRGLQVQKQSGAEISWKEKI